MKIFGTAITLCLFICAGWCAAQTTQATHGTAIYVSPTGNDAGPGTLDRPFATIERARDAVRGLKTHAKDGVLDSDISVILRGGIYTVAKPIVFSVEDSGDAKHSITYMAFPGETPIISGAPVLKLKWTASAPSARPAQAGTSTTAPIASTPSITIWTARVPAGTWFEDLYVNGKRQPKSRIPDAGFIKARDLNQSKTQFGFDPAKLGDIGQDKLRATAIVRTWEWDESLLPVANIDMKTDTITLGRAAGYPIVPKGYGVVGDFALENVPSAIHRANQWALDGDGILTYALRTGVDPGTLEFRGATNVLLFDVRGDAAKSKWVDNLRFQGLTFTQTGRVVNHDWGQFGAQALQVQNGVRDCVIRDCAFHDLGAGGIVAWRHCRQITIDRNEFHDVGDTAITVFDYLGEGISESGGDTIINNTIHDCGTVREIAEAISISGADSNQVAHNLIYNMPYIGICVNGMMPTTWQQKNEPSLKPPFTADRVKPFIRTEANRIEFNHIHDVMRAMADGGGIYFWGTMGAKPNFVTGNLIENVVHLDRTAVGIYMDDWTDGVQIRNNVVVNVNMGLHFHGAPHIVVDNNIFAYCRLVDCSIQPEKYNVGPLESVIVHNIFYDGLGKLTYDWTEWNRKPLSEMNFNCWYRAGKKDLKLGFGQGFDKDSIVADPEFIDPAKPQKGLKPTSPVFKIGIKPIDMSGVGPEPEGRSK